MLNFLEAISRSEEEIEVTPAMESAGAELIMENRDRLDAGVLAEMVFRAMVAEIVQKTPDAPDPSGQ